MIETTKQSDWNTHCKSFKSSLKQNKRQDKEHNEIESKVKYSFERLPSMRPQLPEIKTDTPTRDNRVEKSIIAETDRESQTHQGYLQTGKCFLWPRGSGLEKEIRIATKKASQKCRC